MRLPLEAPAGKRIPFWGRILGRSFRLKADPESASRSERAFRDAVSARGPIGKAHPTPGLDSGSCFPLEPLPKTASHSDVPKRAIERRKTAERPSFLEKVHVRKLARSPHLSTAHGHRLPFADSSTKKSPEISRLPAWLAIRQALGLLSGKFRLVRFRYPKKEAVAHGALQ